MQNTAEDISNAASGHKANLSNPSKLRQLVQRWTGKLQITNASLHLDTSDASKANSKKELESLGGDNAFYGDEDQNKSKNPNNVAGGLKAAINNPQITEEGKKSAQEKLDNL